MSTRGRIPCSLWCEAYGLQHTAWGVVAHGFVPRGYTPLLEGMGAVAYGLRGVVCNPQIIRVCTAVVPASWDFPPIFKFFQFHPSLDIGPPRN